MNTRMLKRVRQMFNCGIPQVDRHNRRQWVASVRYLGPNWVYAKTYKLDECKR